MADPGELDVDDVMALLTTKIQEVMALDDPVSADARFDEDLHADSLDLVEVVEGVERQLAARGATVSLADDELLALTTVRQAAERIHGSIVEGQG